MVDIYQTAKRRCKYPLLFRPSDRVRKKMENYAKIFGNIMRKKVSIMREKSQIMRKFPKLMKLFPLFFRRIKYMLTSFRAF